MRKKIVGATVGTTLSPEKMAEKLKPVKTVNGVSPDKNGNVAINMAVPVGIGFFTFVVDENGDLWVYSEDGEAPTFEYDSETGNLYVVQEQE